MNRGWEAPRQRASSTNSFCFKAKNDALTKLVEQGGYGGLDWTK